MKLSEVVAHNVKFYNLEARAIHCMALERKKKKLALSRSDNSVEIWDVQYSPYLQKVIFSSSPNSIEDLKWYNDRLFSCGLQGYIVEYDCLNQSVLYSVPVTGGPAWCIDINKKKKLLACGTEDGYINILEIGSNKLEHYKFLDKQQGRILCLCWDKSGQHLVTGSVDVIRVWNVESGHAIHKMKTGRSSMSKETVVWCVAVTSDFTIISGDSRGCLCFWDGKIGTQIEINNSHAADILSLAVTEDESVVYCAGVDPVIAMYGKVLDCAGGRRRWAKGGQRKIHEHDVRALVLSSDEKLYSGGIDGYLALSSFPPKVLIKFPPFLKNPSVNIIPAKRYLLLRYMGHLELWKLGQPDLEQDTCDSFLRLNENEVQLLQLKAKNNDVIVCSGISENGQYIAYSTRRAIAFFRFSLKDSVPLSKLSEPNKCGPCNLIQFYQIDQNHFCAVATIENEIKILEIEENGADVIRTLKPLEDETLTDTISHLVFSSNGSYLIAADCESNIAVWSISDWSLMCTLPKYQATVTAISIRKDSHDVVVAYSDFKVVEFSLAEKQYTDFSKNFKETLRGHLHTPVTSIAFDDRRSSSILLHDDSSLCVIDKNEVHGERESKIAKVGETPEEDSAIQQKQAFNVIKKSKHIAAIGWLGGEEMVIVTVCPLKLAENLPPTLARKLFGT